TGHLEVGAESLEPWMRQEGAEPLADLALADVLVAIAVRAERCLRVVEVDRAKSLGADRLVELLEPVVEHRAIGHVDAAHPPVARVEAHAEARVAIGRLDELRELVDVAPDRAALPRAVLKEQPRAVAA